jgi:hypothetical protein
MPGYDPGLDSSTAHEDGSPVCTDPPQGLQRNVAGRVGLLSVEEALKPQRLAARGGRVERRGDEFDPVGNEALDVQDVETLVEPVDQEPGGIDAMSADDARLLLFDRGGVHREGEEPQSRLGESLLDRGAGSADSLAGGRLEVGEAGAQEPPPPRSP